RRAAPASAIPASRAPLTPTVIKSLFQVRGRLLLSGEVTDLPCPLILGNAWWLWSSSQSLSGGERSHQALWEVRARPRRPRVAARFRPESGPRPPPGARFGR